MIKRILEELRTRSRSGNWAIKFLITWQGGEEGESKDEGGDPCGGIQKIEWGLSDREEAGPSMSLHFFIFSFLFECCL